MFLITITLRPEKVAADGAEALFRAHRQWFVRFHEAGNFLLLGPYTDREHSGVIVAHGDDRNMLETILAQDVYYAKGLAEYEVRPFQALLMADGLK